MTTRLDMSDGTRTRWDGRRWRFSWTAFRGIYMRDAAIEFRVGTRWRIRLSLAAHWTDPVIDDQP